MVLVLGFSKFAVSMPVYVCPYGRDSNEQQATRQADNLQKVYVSISFCVVCLCVIECIVYVYCVCGMCDGEERKKNVEKRKKNCDNFEWARSVSIRI